MRGRDRLCCAGREKDGRGGEGEILSCWEEGWKSGRGRLCHAVRGEGGREGGGREGIILCCLALDYNAVHYVNMPNIDYF